MFNLIKKLREQSKEKLYSVNNYNKILNIFDKQAISYNFDLLRENENIQDHVKKISEQACEKMNLKGQKKTIP